MELQVKTKHNRSHSHTTPIAKQLRLGDVILAVNGRSLQGASHAEAVLRLKQAGATVLLRIKPNQVLEGMRTWIPLLANVLQYI